MSSRNSSTSDNESIPDNEVLSCDESIDNTNQSTSSHYKHYIGSQQNSTPSMRYTLSASNTGANTIRNGPTYKETNLLPSVTACGSQVYLENNYMYKAYSYLPANSMKSVPIPPTQSGTLHHHHFQQSQSHHHHHHHNLMNPEVAINAKSPEFVSIRYFAPVQQQQQFVQQQHVSARLSKIDGGSSSGLSSRHRSPTTSYPTAGVNYLPSMPSEKNIFSLDNFGFSNSTNSLNYVANPKFHHVPQTFDMNSYRMINYDVGNLQNAPHPETGINNQHTFSRPVASLWNLAGGAGNQTQSLGEPKYNYKELVSSDNYPNYYEHNGGQRDNKSFFAKIGVPSHDKNMKRFTKIGIATAVASIIVILIIVASILGVLLTRKYYEDKNIAELKLNATDASNVTIIDGVSSSTMRTLGPRNLTSVDINEANSSNTTSTSVLASSSSASLLTSELNSVKESTVSTTASGSSSSVAGNAATTSTIASLIDSTTSSSSSSTLSVVISRSSSIAASDSTVTVSALNNAVNSSPTESSSVITIQPTTGSQSTQSTSTSSDVETTSSQVEKSSDSTQKSVEISNKESTEKPIETDTEKTIVSTEKANELTSTLTTSSSSASTASTESSSSISSTTTSSTSTDVTSVKVIDITTNPITKLQNNEIPQESTTTSTETSVKETSSSKQLSTETSSTSIEPVSTSLSTASQALLDTSSVEKTTLSEKSTITDSTTLSTESANSSTSEKSSEPSTTSTISSTSTASTDTSATSTETTASSSTTSTQEPKAV